ncbi:Ankyrin repeat domain-containing protein 26, partial [Heterocephalus glaber]
KKRREEVISFMKKIKNSLRKKEEQYYQVVEAKHQLGISLTTLDIELKTCRENMSPEVSVSQEDLLHKKHRLQDEISRLRLEIDAIENQNQVKEKKYLEDTEIAHEKNADLQRTMKLHIKNADLQRTMKLNEERILQCNGQLNSLTVENTMLNSKL